ncbi:MAG: hypothetical protein IIC75_08685 [Bacteroidetes bacterium]|nr:hypothetical protein [Bacteroidota bacterium]
MTPRGITIYLPRDYSFALIARLYPKVDAFKVLEKTQGIYRTHSAAGFIIGIVCFLLGLSPIMIAILTFCITLVFFFMRLFGIFIIPGMVVIPTFYSRFTGFGIITIILLLIGYLSVGLIGTLAFIVARLLAEGITMIAEKKSGEKLGIKIGVDPISAKAGAMYFAPVKDFINAYKLYALKYGITVDPNISDEELVKDNWIHVWEDLQNKWPQVAQRFSEDNNENI